MEILQEQSINDYGFALRKIRFENKNRRISMKSMDYIENNKIKNKESIEFLRLCSGIKPNMQYDYKLNIDQIRIEKNLSINDLSKTASISQSYISRLCSGISENPTISKLIKIAKTLNCTLDDLVKIL